MNENEVAIRNGDEIITVNVDDIPEVISSQITKISELEEKVKASDKSAKKAMEYVSSQMSKYEEKGWGIFKHRSGNTKDIVEDTQEAIEKLAEAQQVTVEALNKSFEFQKKLAKASEYLFNLGCANITVNRIAVRAIEAKLSGASKEKISDLARQEMMDVVTQLKQQEDILKKQEELKAKVKKNSDRLNEKDELDEKQSKEIENLNSQLSEKDRIDAEQTQRLEELGAMLENKNSIDQRQEESLKLIFEYMKTKDELDKAQSISIDELKKRRGGKLPLIATVISVAAIIISLIDLYLRFTN